VVKSFLLWAMSPNKPIRQLPHKDHVIDLNHPYIFLCLKINQDLWKLEIGKWELHPSHDTTTCG
jgi:hypothetical protein